MAKVDDEYDEILDILKESIEANFGNNEINQALEKIRDVGWISRSEWPDSAGIRPSEADLSESEGRLLRTVPADELDLVTLQNLAQTAGFELGIEYFPVIDSTNRQLMQRVRDDRAGTTLMVCDYQCAGRGRRGRRGVPC